MASIRGLLAKWLGGASAPPQAGIRSLLARWLGGTGAGAVRTDLECGGSADVARTRIHEASGGSVLAGSAVITQISAAPDLRGGGGRIGIGFPAQLYPKAKRTVEPERKRRVRQTYSYVPDGGLALSVSAAVLRNREILAVGGSTLRVGATVERTRISNSGFGFTSGGLAAIETYDAIYDTEDEEIGMLMAFAA